MNILLWILQVALAAVFLLAGSTKGWTPLAELGTRVPWVPDVPGWVPRLAGFSEILGALGLILPAATRIKPWLTPLAASALGLVMVLAMIFHLVRGEVPAAGFNLALLLVCLLVAWGRQKKVPIQPR